MSAIDFENNLSKYNGSQLFEIYKNLSKVDKLFVHDFINYSVVNHKENKPKFKKKLNTIKDNIVFSALTSNVGSFSSVSVFTALKQNVLQHFSTNLIQ